MTRITKLPSPPTTQDSVNFDIRADAFLESLPRFADELNAICDEMDDSTGMVEAELNKCVDRAKEDLREATNNNVGIFESVANIRKKELLAIAAIKSDSWHNIALFVLFMLKELRLKFEQQVFEQDRTLEYKLFFRSSLPRGYKAPGALLKIADYPLAWWLSLQTDEILRASAPDGYFRLPRGNLYTKGTGVAMQVGSYADGQLLAHRHSYGLWAPSSQPLGGSSRSRNMTGGYFYDSTSVVGGDTNEVNRIHLLEGYYVGE